MSEFHREINNRIAETREHLRRAREEDEHYLAEVRLGELESLVRLATDHGVAVESADV
jgi:hypothetical protein